MSLKDVLDSLLLGAIITWLSAISVLIIGIFQIKEYLSIVVFAVVGTAFTLIYSRTQVLMEDMLERKQ